MTTGVTASVYIETSVFGFYNDTKPESLIKRGWTRQLFAKAKQGRFIPYTSDYVVAELEATPDDAEREAELALIDEYNLNILLPSDKTRWMADCYVIAKLMTKDNYEDALHIASATVNKLPFIVSYNFHIARKNVVTATAFSNAISAVNIQEGYQPIQILTPEEMVKNV